MCSTSTAADGKQTSDVEEGQTSLPGHMVLADALHVIDGGLQPLRDRFGPSPADLVPVMLRYCLEQSVNAAVLVGFTTPGQVTESLTAPASPLAAEDMSFIRDTAGRIQRRLDAAGEVFLDEAKASLR